jgi:hypothetical protein
VSDIVVPPLSWRSYVAVNLSWAEMPARPWQGAGAVPRGVQLR